MKISLATATVLALIGIGFYLWSKNTSSGLTDTQKQRVTVFINWADDLNMQIRAIRGDSNYAHDVKIQSLAVEKDNTVCGVMWFRNPIGGRDTVQYVLYNDPDRIKPIGIDNAHDWTVFGCDNAMPVTWLGKE